MEGITDVDSATSGMPQLKKIDDKISSLSGILDKVPEAARERIQAIVSKEISALQPIIEKVSEIPGVGPVIQPSTDSIMEYLNYGVYYGKPEVSG